MITVLHGDDVVASRQELMRRIEEAKKAGKEVRRLDGTSLDAPMLTQALESLSLFGDTVLVVIEKGMAKGIKLPMTDADVVIWEDREIGKTPLSLLGTHVAVQRFTVPPALWQFLDAIRPHHHALLSLLHRALEQDTAERVFAMVIQRVRRLIMLKDGVTPEGLQGWQASRLTRQAKLFTMEGLLTMENQLLAIDISIKTGSSPFSLAQQLELFVLDI